jgi:hypothetical protein
MIKVMNSLEETIKRIQSGAKLVIAGDEKLLSQLPAGQWIGGTSVYFIGDDGGESTQEKLFVEELPNFVTDVTIREYDAENLSNVYDDAYENGFSIIILPFASEVLFSFAMNGLSYPGFATRPLIGWVSGVKLEDLGVSVPKVYNGSNASGLENKAVVINAGLPANKVADIDIVNIFEQSDGDELTFQTGGFNVSEVLVNGKPENFADYMLRNEVNVKLPLVADIYGIKVNVSFQAIDEAKKVVQLYAPVFPDVTYKLAKPFDSYVRQFMTRLPVSYDKHIAFSCNCILNYLYSKLEGKQTGAITGPITFGEVAFQLLNQTMVYLQIHDI